MNKLDQLEKSLEHKDLVINDLKETNVELQTKMAKVEEFMQKYDFMKLDDAK